MKTGNVMIGSVKSDSIPNSNYLTPSKKEIDSWDSNQAFEWLNRLNDMAYRAATTNEESNLRSVTEAIDSVKNYLIKKRKFGFKKKK
jgi:hypothetical protein